MNRLNIMKTCNSILGASEMVCGASVKDPNIRIDIITGNGVLHNLWIIHYY